MHTLGPYHHGELAVQARAGVQAQARRVGRIIDPTIPPPMRAFLADPRPWQSPAAWPPTARSGPRRSSARPAFCTRLVKQTLDVAAAPVPGDPLHNNVQVGHPLGLLVIDLATRRRVRLNGTVQSNPTGGFALHTAEVFGNCQQYIQRRDVAAAVTSTATPQATVADTLDAGQQRLIASADTFFIASYAGRGRCGRLAPRR